MKKILLLSIACMLFILTGCEKDGDLIEHKDENTIDVKCSCGAEYKVTCKYPDYQLDRGKYTFWVHCEGPSFMWEVRNAVGEFIPFEERTDHTKMKFVCPKCGAESRTFSIIMFQH